MTRVGLFLNTEMSKPCFFTFYCTRKFLVTTIGHLAAKNSYLVASWHPQKKLISDHVQDQVIKKSHYRDNYYSTDKQMGPRFHYDF